MTAADLIEVLRDAAEALAIASIRGRTDTEIAELAYVAGRCMDAALELARRQPAGNPNAQSPFHTPDDVAHLSR